VKVLQRVGLLFFPAFDWSLGASHPEREERLLYTRDQIMEEGIMDLPQFKVYAPILADKKDIQRTHALLPQPDLHLTPPHRIAAGGAITLAKAIMAGEVKRGFALVRPPGHHAMHTVYGNRGFCTINNAAVTVNYLRSKHGIKRIAIVDTDVHHGDGTQDVFYHDPDVLFISIHQDGRTLYPGTGFPGERGGPQAFGQTLNIPLPPETGDKGLLYVLEELVLPALEEFKPELIINSAGQDNHYTDPLANMNISAHGYGDLTRLIKPDLAVLEGGYAIESALPYVNLAILLAMAGLDYTGIKEEVPPPIESVSIRELKPLIQAMKASKGNRPSPQEWYDSDRTIFYDTEHLLERRIEKIRGCSQCSGLHLTYTGAAANPRPKVDNLVIRLPFGVCAGCRRQAEKSLIEARNSGSWRTIYWQDQAEDEFVYHTGEKF